jgi:hypothetical protein
MGEREEELVVVPIYDSPGSSAAAGASAAAGVSGCDGEEKEKEEKVWGCFCGHVE